MNLRFIGDFLDEKNVGSSNANNQGNPRVDFLGYRDFTTLIEIKTPETKFFTDKNQPTARTNTWSFSSDFIDGVSQCLAQKDDWSKNSTTTVVSDDDKQALDMNLIRTIDPRAIFIIGNKEKEINTNSRNTDIWRKRDTLERFIQNNKHMLIISFDELYDRACQIVEGMNRKQQFEEKD